MLLDLYNIFNNSIHLAMVYMTLKLGYINLTLLVKTSHIMTESLLGQVTSCSMEMLN